MIWQQGGEVLDKAGKKALFAGAQGVKALQLLTDMALKDKSLYPDQTPDTQKMYGLFDAGKMAMIVTGPWQLSDIATTTSPTACRCCRASAASHETISGPDVYMVFNHSDERRRAATEFMAWLHEPAQDAAVGHRRGNLPLSAKTAALPGYKAYAPSTRASTCSSRTSRTPTTSARPSRSTPRSRSPSARRSRPRCSGAAAPRTRSRRRPRPPTKPWASADGAAGAAGGRHRPPAWRRALPENLTGWGFVLPASVLVLGLGFFPVIWSFLLSTKSASGFGPEQSVGLANYRELAHDPEWLDAVSRSLKFTLLYVPTTVLLGLGLALLLNQKIRFIGFYRTCFFVPFVASAAATGVIFLYVLDPQYGIVDNGLAWMGFKRQLFLEDPDWALFLLAPIYTWTAVGFDVLIYLAALQDVPQDQSEAARIDGAGRFAVFRHVVLPAVRPITVLAVVWETINALQFFDLAWTTKRGGPIDATTVIIVYGYKLGFVGGQQGLGAAVACVLFLAIVALVLVQVVYVRRRRIDVF